MTGTIQEGIASLQENSVDMKNQVKKRHPTFWEQAKPILMAVIQGIGVGIMLSVCAYSLAIILEFLLA